MKTFGTFVLVVLGFVVPSYALDLQLNDLDIANRAQCAVASQSPSKSAFLIVDGYNAGRLSYGLAKSVQKEPESLTTQGMKEFRLAVSGLETLILNKLNAGELPLLPVNLNKSQLKYANIASACNSEVYCPELSGYLRNLWQASTQTDAATRLQKIQKLDGFTKESFLNPGEQHNRCYYLKKFSPLQSHLYGTDIRQKGLENLAQALSQSDSYLTDCQDASNDLDSRSAALQIEVFSQNKNWDKLGFDYWNSLKIYLSWAWRNADELKQYAPTFHAPFRNLDLEDSLLFVSNGCKSLTQPQCDSENLSLNSLRELAKVKMQSTEFDTLIGSPAEEELLKKGARAVNNDFLSLADYEKASDWVKTFGDQLKERQTIFRNKLLNAHQFFSITSSQYSAQELVQDVEALAKRGTEFPALKNEFYYMCAEWSLSADPQFDFLYSDILKIPQIDNMLQQSTSVGADIPAQIEYFRQVASELKILCHKLEDEDYFDYTEETLPKRGGYRPWAQEILSPIQDPHDAITGAAFVLPGESYLTTGKDSTVTLCHTSVDCARNTLKYAVDLLNVSKFANAFLNEGHVRSSEMLNPYNELAACKVYDPYFTKKRVRKRFVGDLINTAISGATGIPLYLDVDFTPDKVTSLKRMIENGEVKFDPDIQKGKMAMAAVADLGPLVGAPCAIQVSPNADKAYNFYAFGGISVNACTVKSKRGVDYTTAKDASVNRPTDRSFCAGCVINFVGVSSAVSYTQTSVGHFNPLKTGVYLFRAFYRFFKGMKDPVNIPRNFSLNLNLLKETYDTYQGIPVQCVEDLKKGKPCKVNYCEAMAAKWIGEKSTEVISKVSVRKKGAQFMSIERDKCGFEYDLKFTCDEKAKTAQLIDLTKTKKYKNKCSTNSMVIGENR